MDDFLSRFFGEMLGRTDGPFSFRFILQPVMAMFYAYRDGVKDARAGRPLYSLWIFTHPDQRGPMLREGVKAVGRVIGLGVIMDLAYQVIVLGSFRPLELIVIVLVLAFVPYLLLRGPFNRLMRRRLHLTGEQ
jgi:hypothetical protein